MSVQAQFEDVFQNVMDMMAGERGFYLFTWDVEKNLYTVCPEVDSHFLPADGVEGGAAAWLDTVVYEADRQVLRDTAQQLLRGEETHAVLSFRLVSATGQASWYNARFYTHCSEGRVQSLGGYLSSMYDVRGADPVTHLLGHTQFLHDYADGFDDGREGYVAVFDIDDYKYLREKNGRHFGDELLRVLTAAIERSIPGRARLYRMEYDRFVTVLHDLAEQEMTGIYKTVRDELRETAASLRPVVLVTLSCGVAAFPADARALHDLTRYAQNALNTAKVSGKNNIAFFSLPEYQLFEKEQALRADLRRSISAGFEGFEVYYQPQVNMVTGRLKGAEALLRWQTPERGSVPPVFFIPLLERGGMIVEVGSWVLEQALAQCASWRKTEPDFCVSVNISYTQLEEDDLVGRVAGLLAKYNLPGEALLLELTESEHLHNYNYFNETLEPLSAMGVSVAIDDFGTGYSSLGYFKELHINQVKIDRCFVTRIRESEYDFKLIEFIIELAHSTNMEVCVEGVETVEELKTLMPLAPNLVQGYFFGRPVPAATFEADFLGHGVMVPEEVQARTGQLHEEAQRASPLYLSAVEEFKQMLDSLEDLIHISDLQTGRLLYMNRAARKSLGFTAREYTDQYCFKLLHDRGLPCEQCQEMTLSREDFHTWYTVNAAGQKFRGRVKLIPWDGRQVRLGICTHLGTDAPTLVHTHREETNPV